MSYNPWGQRRDLVNLDTLLGPFLPNFGVDTTNRGYTDHEMVDSVGIIHMNGRIYDPKLGRMMQADPIVQSPRYTQSFNRYSYTFNNPLRFVDPSGYNAKEDNDLEEVVVTCGPGCGGGPTSGVDFSGLSGANNGTHIVQSLTQRDIILGNHLKEGEDYDSDEKAKTPRYNPEDYLFNLFHYIIGDASGTGYYTSSGDIVDAQGNVLKKADQGEEGGLWDVIKEGASGKIGPGFGTHLKDVKAGPLKFGGGVVFASGGVAGDSEGLSAWGKSTADLQLSFGRYGGRVYLWDIDVDSHGINNLDTWGGSKPSWDWSIGIGGTITPYSFEIEYDFQPLINHFRGQ
jgi:RHS repeat-associated protein